MDLYVKRAVIHQFTPDETDLLYANQLLTLTPQLDEYLRKKIERVYSDEAKRGQFSSDHAFLDLLTDELMTTSVNIAKVWREAFIISENQKTNDLIFVEFDKAGQPHLAFLRVALRENLVHAADPERPIQISQNNLPGPGSAPDEALIINRTSLKYHLLEKRIKHNGSFLNYFSEQLLQVAPQISPKKSIKTLEKVAQKVADSFNQDDFQFQSKVKTAIFNHIEEENALSPEKLADALFDQNLTARLTFVDELKEVMPQPLQFDEIDTSRQLKRLENQKLSLSNGIELIVPNQVYEDAETVEFIQNANGTYSILIKNIEDITNK